MGLTTKEISSSSFNDMISSVDRRSEYVENRAGANVRLNNFLTPYTLDDKSSILNAPCGYSNGVYPSLRPVRTFGPELITNGDFATDSDWTYGSSWSIANGKATATNSTTGSIYQDVLDTSKIYKATFEITEITSGGLRIGIGVNFSDYFTETGIYTYYGQPTTDGLLRINPLSGTNASIDNVSVKEVFDADFDFTRGSAATRVTKDGLIKNVQILSDDLVQNGNFEEVGPELVTNGGFNTDSDWTLGNGSYISESSLILPNTGTALQTGVPNNTMVRFDVQGSGTIGYRVNTGVSYQQISLPQTIYLTTGSSGGRVQFSNTSGDEVTIDNVSVKEVGQNWNFVGDTTVVNNGAKFDNTSVYSEIQQNNVTTSGSRVRLTITVEDYVSGKILFPQFGVADGNGDPNFDISANGTYVFEGILYSSSFTVKRGVNGTDLVVSNISLIEITDDTDLPRIDYTNGTGSLLLEPQSTNLLTYSEDFSQSYWNKIQISVDDDFIISPDGTQNASKITTNSNTPYLGNTTISLTTGNVYTISCFVKKGTNRWVRLSSVSSGTLGAWFDLDNNVVGTVNSTSASIENYGNGWYRISNTLTAISGSNQTFLGLSDGDGGTTVTGTGHTVFAWGLQVEEQSFATSYIPTSGSTVTRNAEVCNNAGSSDLINSTEGVLYAEIAALSNDGTIRRISLSDGGTSNRLEIFYGTIANRIDYNIYSNSSFQASGFSLLSSATDFNKIAVKYKENDFALWVNGTEASTDPSGSTPIGLNKLQLQAASGSDDFYGKVECVAVFKEALTDEELAKITSTTQQEVFYEMRDRMLQINADYYEFGDYTTRLKKLF